MSQTWILGYAGSSTQYTQLNNRSPNNHRRNQNAPRLHVLYNNLQTSCLHGDGQGVRGRKGAEHDLVRA